MVDPILHDQPVPIGRYPMGPCGISEINAEPDSTAIGFAHASEQLVRRVFDVSLRLQVAQESLDQARSQPEQLHEIVSDVLDELNQLIRATGLTMLAYIRERGH